jgi:hypothetical protein
MRNATRKTDVQPWQLWKPLATRKKERRDEAQKCKHFLK